MVCPPLSDYARHRELARPWSDRVSPGYGQNATVLPGYRQNVHISAGPLQRPQPVAHIVAHSRSEAGNSWVNSGSPMVRISAYGQPSVPIPPAPPQGPEVMQPNVTNTRRFGLSPIGCVAASANRAPTRPARRIRRDIPHYGHLSRTVSA